MSSRSRLRSRLVGGPTGDPAVFVDVVGARRSLLLDCGDLGPLEPAELLRVGDCFVSHAHLDHFYGFDRLLRANIGAVRRIRVWGPEGMIDRVGGRLAGYHWNLYDEPGLEFEVTEIARERFRVQTFQVRDQFRPPGPPLEVPPRPRLLDDDVVSVEWTILDHFIPCLAYALVEPAFLNVDPARLAETGLEPGPWVQRLKDLAAAGADPCTQIETPGGMRALGPLADRLLVQAKGGKLAYVTDTLGSPATEAAVVELARGADLFYCEHYYLDEDRSLAEKNRHLTARQAGRMARAAGARELVGFHHSPKYSGRYEDLIAEGQAAFRGA